MRKREERVGRKTQDSQKIKPLILESEDNNGQTGDGKNTDLELNKEPGE